MDWSLNPVQPIFCIITAFSIFGAWFFQKEQQCWVSLTPLTLCVGGTLHREGLLCNPDTNSELASCHTRTRWSPSSGFPVQMGTTRLWSPLHLHWN